jgi:ABC-type nitrate/sulfonate/bicarbonate transport system permease component
MFASLLVLMIIALSLNTLLSWAERRLLHWKDAGEPREIVLT